jgi:hypothetical protein
MEDNQVNAVSNLKVDDLKVCRERGRCRTPVSWDAGDCFVF